jgi:hypothetical protein
MANKTLLNSVNEIFRRVGMIQGDAALLTSLTDQSRQRSIDIAVQVINEGIDELYSTSALPMPSGQAESTFTLATGTRSYTLATGLVRITPYDTDGQDGTVWAIDKTNTQFIYEYPGGYNGLLLRDPEQDDTGLPYWAAINPTDGTLQVDRAPTSAENGNVYTYQYEKELTLTSASDTVPFGLSVFRAMVPTWVQLYRRDQQNEFDLDLFKANMGRAARLLSRIMPDSDYCPR